MIPMKRIFLCLALSACAIQAFAQTPDSVAFVYPVDTIALNALTFRAQRVVEKGGKFRVVPDSRDVAVSARGIDLLDLQPLPGLKVDRALKSVTVDGGTPVFKINGREVEAPRVLNLDPGTVRRIEYSNSPGLRYLDRGATGVINFVLKDADDGGGFYADGSTDPLLMMSDAYVTGNYHKGRSEFALVYQFSRRHYEHGPNEDYDSYIAPERTVERISKTERPVYYMMNNLAAEYTYQPDDSTMFVASLRNEGFESDNIGFGTMLKTDRGVTSATTVNSESPSVRIHPSLDLFYSRRFAGGRSLELNAVGEYSSSRAARNITYTYADGTATSFPTEVYNHGWALSAEGVYGRQFDRMSMKLGVQYQHNYASNDYRISGVVSEMTKDNTYVFGLAEGQAGEKVSWSAGTGAKIFAVVDGGSARTYVRNLSTAQLNWRLSDRWSLTGEVRYTPSLPSLADLSPVFQRTDDVEAAQGFAGLKPSQMLDSRLLVRFAARNGFYTNLQTGYRKSFGEIITTYRYDRATGLFVSSPQNSDYYNNLYVTGEVGIKGLFDHVNVSFDGKLMREQTKGDGFHHVNDNLCVNVNAQAYWEKFLIGCNFNLKPEWCMSGEFLSKSEQAQNIYAQYSFRNLKVSLTWHCPFNPQGYSYETVFLSEIHPGRHINWTTDNGNMVTFGLTWNLDFGSAFHKGAKTLHNGGYDAGTVR